MAGWGGGGRWPIQWRGKSLASWGGGGSRRTVAEDKYGFEIRMQMQLRRKG